MRSVGDIVAKVRAGIGGVWAPGVAMARRAKGGDGKLLSQPDQGRSNQLRYHKQALNFLEPRSHMHACTCSYALIAPFIAPCIAVHVRAARVMHYAITRCIHACSTLNSTHSSIDRCAPASIDTVCEHPHEMQNRWQPPSGMRADYTTVIAHRTPDGLANN